MWMIIPALSLALAHIAGDNIAVVPDMAVLTGNGIYLTVFIAYFVLGCIVTGILAWIGMKTGLELQLIIRRYFGRCGKIVWAVTILAICIPASALTGCYFAGWILHESTGIEHSLGGLISLLLFSWLASGRWPEVLKTSNYFALLLIPLIFILAVIHGVSVPSGPWYAGPINWWLVLALVAYNAGGIHSILVVEAAAHLYKRGNKAIWLTVIAKIAEGLFTFFVAGLVIGTGAQGPLSLMTLADQSFLAGLGGLFNIILFCVLLNTMVPAMIVNAKQIGILTNFSFRASLGIAAIAVWLISRIHFAIILSILSAAACLMILLIVYTMAYLHMYRQTQPK
ncbi:Hypothetical protein LUCI_1259 [Lucifera butyrica]|uniref:Uncharacterized protein n=1 Tax=Lucifera butyrica TaxID=1351585 RepID=A0A498RA66_9FIRM|nr:hypothetical protein [Lucifera butyrica]VBB06048.1 Hypothetical protein LUCI_1259 [Lucifera butyrica]